MGGTLDVVRGMAKDFSRQVRDGQGAAFDVTTSPFSAGTPLAARVWTGDDRPAVATPAASWADATTGTYVLSFAESDTAPLAVGTYAGQTVATLGGRRKIVDEFRLAVSAAPGTAAALPSFTTYNDLLLYCPWLEDLQADADQTGFQEEQARATSWLVDLIVDLFKWQNLGPTIGQPGYGVTTMFGGSSAPNLWFRQQVTPVVPGTGAAYPPNSGNPAVSTALIVREKTKEIVAKKAISYVLEAQVGRDSTRDWWALASRFRRDAKSLLGTYVAEIDLSNPPTGWASITVNCGGTDLR